MVSAQCTYTEFSILEHALADYTYSSQHILRRKCDDVVFQFDGEADLESSKLCHRVRDYSTEKKEGSKMHSHILGYLTDDIIEVIYGEHLRKSMCVKLYLK